MLLCGCSAAAQRGWMPPPRAPTNQTGRIMELWNGSWVAALAVGVLVWGLIIWCVVAYRRGATRPELPDADAVQHADRDPLHRRPADDGVGALLLHRARPGEDQQHHRDSPTSRSTSSASSGPGTSTTGPTPPTRRTTSTRSVPRAELDGKPGVEAQLPTLYLPVDKRVEFVLTSRDVIHSFWVPGVPVQDGRDPGLENRFQVVPQRGGHLQGQVRRALRRVPLRDAVQRRGGLGRGVPAAHRGPAGQARPAAREPRPEPTLGGRSRGDPGGGRNGGANDLGSNSMTTLDSGGQTAPSAFRSDARSKGADRRQVADDDRPQGHRQPLPHHLVRRSSRRRPAWRWLIRAELFEPGMQVVQTKEQYNQLFTMHGMIMLLLFATPPSPASRTRSCRCRSARRTSRSRG